VEEKKVELNELAPEVQALIADKVNAMRKDMEAPEITNQIIANFNLARGLRLFQTPSFVVAGHILTQASAELDCPKLAAAARAH
jgi:hypothetical protein